ncbi:uracil-DNA glycosylase [Nocardioides cavernaquae]|uniref:Uracil-DNA glycosylase n=1 Tax=Nocardioides cavernaquae TaxID=2321396 RepID=A0A3A5H9D6_9ACTN|nr:uracil-DNA glycosylase [Nocardioides cavernaquae]RJS46458.1 uracil-DNA glycosylase [Nocardioides cavernaquae]
MTKVAESVWAIPESWTAALQNELEQPYWASLTDFVDSERRRGDVYPPPSDVFNALALTPLGDVRVVILGQDPYHGRNQAHGLCFSVREGVTIPPSLRKILSEIRADDAGPAPTGGNLTSWATQGVLLLNATLTVASGAPKSHEDRGWETFTDAVIRAVNAKSERVVFVLWGDTARAKRKLITNPIHAVVESAHPAARANAKTPFVGSRPFAEIDRLLGDRGPIDWTPGI